MAWYDILKYIVMIIVILGVLIALHELGHLSMAKLFNVYCFDYSIGFGPAFLHKRRKGGETYFSLRAIPLGGFVTMYGEPGVVPEGMEEPPEERSLNSIHKGKKALILAAGVIVNFLLGFILIGISSFAFPQYYYAYGGYISESLTINYVRPVYADQALTFIDAHKAPEAQAQEYVLPFIMIGIVGSIISQVKLEEEPRVAVYYPQTLIQDRPFSDFIRLYPILKDAEGNVTKPSSVHQELGINYYPDIEKGYLNYTSENFQNASFALHPHFVRVVENMKSVELVEAYKNKSIVPTNEFTYKISAGKLTDNGMTMPVIKSWNGWERGWQDWGQKSYNAVTAVGQGLASLFTGGFQNLSGIVGMTAALPQIENSGGWSNIFFFAGLLSINLGFFNLLPFPGLDGWQLLTTAVEGITRKKIPAKIQGMGLLFLLAIVILVKDIVGLF